MTLDERPIVTWGRLVYLLVVTPLVLVVAAVVTLFAPGAMALSYGVTVYRADMTPCVSVYCMTHRGWSRLEVDWVTVLHDNVRTRIYSPGLRCADTTYEGPGDRASLGLFSEPLLAERLRGPSVSDPEALASILAPWIREIANAGPSAMMRTPFPQVNYEAPMDSDRWYSDTGRVGEAMYARPDAAGWFAGLLAVGAVLELLGFVMLTRRGKRVSAASASVSNNLQTPP